MCISWDSFLHKFLTVIYPPILLSVLTCMSVCLSVFLSVCKSAFFFFTSVYVRLSPFIPSPSSFPCSLSLSLSLSSSSSSLSLSPSPTPLYGSYLSVFLSFHPLSLPLPLLTPIFIPPRVIKLY